MVASDSCCVLRVADSGAREASPMYMFGVWESGNALFFHIDILDDDGYGEAKVQAVARRGAIVEMFAEKHMLCLILLHVEAHLARKHVNVIMLPHTDKNRYTLVCRSRITSRNSPRKGTNPLLSYSYSMVYVVKRNIPQSCAEISGLRCRAMTPQRKQETDF